MSNELEANNFLNRFGIRILETQVPENTPTIKIFTFPNKRKFINVAQYRTTINEFLRNSIILDDSVISIEINDLLDDDSYREGSQYLTFKIKINNKFFKNDLYCFTFRNPEDFNNEKEQFEDLIKRSLGH